MSTTASHTTTDHEVIKNWVEKRSGKPACVKGTGNNSDEGLLRINFPAGAEESLENISWDEFFDKFEQERLAFLYQDETSEGKESRFNKLVNREN